MYNYEILVVRIKSQYNALTVFEDELIRNWIDLGIKIRQLDSLDEASVKKAAEQKYDAVLVMNGAAADRLENLFQAPVYAYYVDHPIYQDPRLKSTNSQNCILVNEDFKSYVDRYYQLTFDTAVLMQAGVEGQHSTRPFAQRKYPVVFCGSYGDCSAILCRINENEMSFRKFLHFMIEKALENPCLRMEDLYDVALKEFNLVLNDDEYTQFLFECQDVERYLRAYYRSVVIRQLVDSGIPVEVYGENWELLDCDRKELLHCHPSVDYREMLDVFADAQIVINVMPWAKSGFHDRIACGMLNGALVVSDETSYMREEALDGEKLVLYSLNDIVELPDKVAYYLEHLDEAEKIAKQGYEWAKENHTWRNRAEQFADIIKKNSMKNKEESNSLGESRRKEMIQNKDGIIALLDKEQWEQAAEAISKTMEKGIYDDTIAVLAATVNEHYGDTESFLLNIETGLKYNHENYELYLMLGNFHADTNPNQAFLCYENAEYYCEKNGNEEDLICIRQIKESLLESQKVTVKPYSFVILSYNTLEVTKQCIESIRQNCNPETYELIVIDNASHDGSVKWLREQTDIVLIENQENVGFPAGCNQGIAASIPENDIMLLNSDTIVMPNAMFTLRMGLYDSQRNGAAGSVTNKAGNSQKIDKVFDNIAQYHTFAATNNVPCENAYEYKVWLVGFALLLKRTALDQVGLLDERFTPGNFEDNDLGIRFSKKGFRNVLCWNSFIYHWESKSFKQNKSINYDQLYYTNLEKYKEKWGIGPSYYTNAREDIMGMITQDSQSFIRVLEIGCGAGVTLGRILHCYPNAEAYGIELVKEIADLGALNYNVICGNIEQMELPYEKGYFDYIIFGDVLEHLVHPDRVLMRVCDYLKQDGCVLASIPNLMNAEVIYDLLHGRFPYEDSGVRDATHLRFFTYQEILRLFETAGYQVEGVWRTMMEECTTNAYGDFFNQLLAIEGVAGREEFDAYQYLVRARVAL